MQRWGDDALLRDRERPRESFSVFYRRHVTNVLAFYARQGVPVTQAGDLTAETFAAALLGRDRYAARRPSATPWLLGIAGRKLADSHGRGPRDTGVRLRPGLERVESAGSDRAA